MGNKVANGERQLEIGEVGIMLDDSPAIRGKGYTVEALNMVFKSRTMIRNRDVSCVDWICQALMRDSYWGSVGLP
jgi:hypothetical protein